MMALEIERKYLINKSFLNYVTKTDNITQGFLSTNPKRTVRIRVVNKKGFITIKGKGSNSGTTRFEWEKEIDYKEAVELLKLCKRGVISKTRHTIPIQNNLNFEVDVFHDQNEGLIIAEIELPSENTNFEKPSWLGKEVTGEVKYYNSMLSKNPYKNW